MTAVKSLNLLKSLVLSGALAASFGAAHATTFTYDLIGATTSAGTLSGTVSIDSVTDLVTTANITFNDAAVGSPVFTNIGSPNAYNGLGQDYISGNSNSVLNYGGQIALYYDTANVGTGNLGICLYLGPCGTQGNGQGSFVQVYTSGSQGGPFNLTAGSLSMESTIITSPAPVIGVVPEPKSLLLLGTGIVALAAFVRLRPSKA